jgi:prevent-host-death family protein
MMTTQTTETITATELRRSLAEVLDQMLMNGQPVAITRQGRTIAYLVPPRVVDDMTRERK